MFVTRVVAHETTVSCRDVAAYLSEHGAPVYDVVREGATFVIALDCDPDPMIEADARRLVAACLADLCSTPQPVTLDSLAAKIDQILDLLGKGNQ